MDPKICISKDSWHYRYFCYIRSLWGVHDEKKVTSLCPYVQTMLWASLFAVVLSPAILLGWIILKGFRISYKGLELMGFSRTVDWLDGSGIADAVDAASGAKMTKYPILTLIGTVIVTVTSIGLLVMAIGVIGAGLLFVIANIATIPGAIYQGMCLAALKVGWGIVYIFSVPGYLLHICWACIYDTVMNAPLWYEIGFYLLAGILATAVSTLIIFMVYMLGKTKLGVRLCDFTKFKINGFADARMKAQTRRAVETQKKAKVPETRSLRRSALQAVADGLGWLGSFFWARKENIKGGTIMILTPLGSLALWLWSFKKRACPLVEFIGDDQIASSPDESEEKESDDEDEEASEEGEEDDVDGVENDGSNDLVEESGRREQPAPAEDHFKEEDDAQQEERTDGAPQPEGNGVPSPDKDPAS